MTTIVTVTVTMMVTVTVTVTCTQASWSRGVYQLGSLRVGDGLHIEGTFQVQIRTYMCVWACICLCMGENHEQL
jgi:hypothetical protein